MFTTPFWFEYDLHMDAIYKSYLTLKDYISITSSCAVNDNQPHRKENFNIEKSRYNVYIYTNKTHLIIVDNKIIPKGCSSRLA